MLSKERVFFKDPQVYQLEDLQFTSIFNDPDRKKSQSIFNSNNKNSNIPIIIDYGSNATKAGWGNSEYPSLVFRSVVSKNKDLKNADGTIIVGNKLKDFDYTKNNYKSPFERNVIQHFGLLENLNDYAFAEIGVNDSKVNHPVIVTECFANPDYCRSRLFEQMFECYQVPSLLVGVDALFSHYYNSISQKNAPSDCLLISLGHNTTHIIPIIKGEMRMKDIKRVNVGGYNSFDLTFRHLNLKYPQFKQKLGQNHVQAIMENLTFAATNYQDQLNYFRFGKDYFKNTAYMNSIAFENNKLAQETLPLEVNEPVILEFPTNPEQMISLEEINRKQELKKERAQRLRDTMQKRKEEKKKAKEEEVQMLEQAVAEIEKDESKIPEYLTKFGVESQEEIQVKLITLKQKLGLMPKEAEGEKVSYLNIPDDQLTPEELKKKRMQKVQQQNKISRQVKKEMETKKKEELNKLKEENPEVYLADLYEKRRKVAAIIEEKKKARNEFSGKRNSRGNQNRLQTLLQLSESQKDKKGNVVDTFGMRDSDWEIYKAVSKEPIVDEDEEVYMVKLNEIDKELQKLDPNFEEMTKNPQEELPELFPQDANHIELDVDQIRGPEVFFQPSLVGVDQMGLADTIDLIFHNPDYTQEIKNNLLKNILLTGGSSFTKNFAQRLKKELESLNPMGVEISIKIAKDPIFDTWRGMQNFAKKKENLTKYGVTKAEYEENGAHYFKPNPFSNIYDA